MAPGLPHREIEGHTVTQSIPRRTLTLAVLSLGIPAWTDLPGYSADNRLHRVVTAVTKLGGGKIVACVKYEQTHISPPW